ncbi:MAG: hypothetical protein WBG69_05210, partial [Arcobacteraceae bacterium]
IAIDKPMSFETAWRYTKKYKLLCFLMIILFPLFFSSIVGGIYAFIINILVTTISIHFNILSVFLNVIVSVFLVSALSNTYMYIDYMEDFSKDKNDDVEVI